MEKILTVVIPSYNTSKFIDESMSTFVKCKNLKFVEILVIDDGSKDDTADKAKLFEEKYPDSIKVISKKNGGHGSGINVGLKNATGKYYKVIDGDDFVNSDEFDGFIDQLCSIDSDMIITDFTTISDVTGKFKTVTPYDFRLIEEKKKLSVNQEYNAEEILPYVYASIHSVTFRTNILKNNGIKMTEQTFYEDNEYVLFPIPYIRKIFLSDKNVYVYRIDQANQSISRVNTQKRLPELKKIVINLVEYYEKMSNDVPVENQKYYLRAVANQIYVVFGIYMSFDNYNKYRKELIQFDLLIKQKSKKIFAYANHYNLVKYTRLLRYFPLIKFLQKMFRIMRWLVEIQQKLLSTEMKRLFRKKHEDV